MMLEILAILFYGIGDLLTTKIGMNMKMGERNPLVRTVFKKTGFVGFIIFKSAIISIGIMYLPTLTLIMAAVGIFCTAWNVKQIVRHRGNIQKILDNDNRTLEI